MEQALGGIKVLDLTQYIAGPYCTRLLAGFGADVIKVEAPGTGDPARLAGPFLNGQPGPERSGLFLYLNNNKRSITLDLKSKAGSDAFRELAKDADIVFESFRPGVMDRLGLGYQSLRELNPGLVVTSISNFGQTGPYRDYKLNHLIAWGMAGGHYVEGAPRTRPVQPGGWITHCIAGVHAAAGAAAALYQRNETGRGQHVDISISESMLPAPVYPAVVYSYRGEIYNMIGRNHLGIFPCRDGHIGLNLYGRNHWELMCAFFGLSDLLLDPRFATQYDVNANLEEARKFFYDLVKDRDKEELFNAGNEWRIPFGMVPTTADILRSPQHAAREFFDEVTHPVIGKVTMPGAPFKMMGTPWRQRNPAPLLGEHNEDILGHPPTARDATPGYHRSRPPFARPDKDNKPRRLLDGIRVTDVTNSWAGPYATQFLAAMGAEVIKVETTKWLDPWRGVGAAGLAGQVGEMAPTFNTVGTNKLSVTLDLTHPSGARIFKQLVGISDIVAENYTPRVMKNFGLDYEALKQVNPAIIMLSMPSHGMTGPWREYPGFAALFEQMSGLPQLTGYPDGPPKMTDWGFADIIGGANGRAALMFALLHRQMTGEGQYIDMSQVEACTCLLGDAIVEYSMNGQIRPRRGNRHPEMAPHGYYCCRGDDFWVAIAVSSDQEWRQFCKTIGDPLWTREARFSDGPSRWRHQDEMDKLIETWTLQQDHYEVMNALQQAGVAAGAIPTGPELLADPHWKERGVFEIVDRAVVGPHPYPKSAPMKLSESLDEKRQPAPTLGEHNWYVLHDLLGISEQEIKSLTDDDVIGTEPLIRP